MASLANSRIQRVLGHLQSGQAASVSPSPTAAGSPRSPDDVVIVSAIRTAIGKARKGSFKDTTPDVLLRKMLEATIARTGIDHKEIGDIVVGNVQMGGSYAGPARIAMLMAGFPVDVPINSVNRQCSSGLQAVANIAASIKAGFIDCGIGAGVESMSTGGGVADKKGPPPIDFASIMEHPLAKSALLPMGTTSEIVAERYGITREQQDQMAFESHSKALNAQATGRFNDEIVPITVTIKDKEGNEREIVVTNDDGPRKGTTMAGLAKLRTVFKKVGGTTTAGNASQVSDGAAAVLLMTRSKANSLGLPIIGRFLGYKVVGVEPDEMGVGPAAAIPAALDQVGLSIGDIDVYEINEAFASQAVYCVKKLGIPMRKVNPLGGAISLGHPLACTGARQIATLLHELRRTNGRYGVVSMCIGTGMGAAGVFEAE